MNFHDFLSAVIGKNVLLSLAAVLFLSIFIGSNWKERKELLLALFVVIGAMLFFAFIMVRVVPELLQNSVFEWAIRIIVLVGVTSTFWKPVKNLALKFKKKNDD